NYMQVAFENDATPVLQNYRIDSDRAKMPPSSSGAPEYELSPSDLGDEVPIVKRYSVDVADGNGLQIKLQSLAYRNPAINGLRILKTAAPRVTDVVVKGSSWAPGVEYSFASLVPQGYQLRPIPMQNATTIEIHFD